ncbi:MAG: translation elongation factor Ts [Erysipelotrichaceae bacterium]
MVTAQLVKELREKTGAGMMDCKKALTETGADIEKAIDWLREKGIAKAAKKSDRVAAEGLTRAAVQGNTAIVFEINSETDFVAKNEQFLALFDRIEKIIFEHLPKTAEEALALNIEGTTLETILAEATATIGEKITLRRLEVITKEDADTFGAYVHMGGKISSVAVMKNTTDAELAKYIAMQVASMSPSFVSRNDMSQDFITHERNIQLEILKNDESLASKPEKVLQGIVEGRLSKSLQEMCLVDQIYFMNPDLKVAEFLKQNNTECAKFVRYAVGEGIEKKENNFAEEVMNQAFGK